MDPLSMMYDFESSAEGAEALGTGETESPDAGQPAGALNTDTAGEGGTPETIPYSRFKEVNDSYRRLAPFEELAEAGYDADSLRQLAEFEAGFKADPVSTWFAIAQQVEGIPTEVKELAQQHLTGSGGSPAGSNDTTPALQGDSQEGSGEPEWARAQREEIARLKAANAAREEREFAEANDRLLNGIMDSWKTADQNAGIDPPDERKMLTFIMAHARGSNSVEEILENARGEYMELREEMLGSAIKPGANLGAPLSVPSGSAPVNTAGEPKTLAEASARAKLRLEQMGSA
jgi:hypothetical protein